MSLHADLLEQAQHLACRERKRPKQASLRRAVSAAYYALFHFLTDRASRLLVSGTGNEALRHAASRGFQHAQMFRTSKAFGGSESSAWKSISTYSVPWQVQDIARVFLQLQLARHEADYDLTRDFNRTEVLALIKRVADAIADWPAVKNHEQAHAYLLGLVLHTR